MQPERESRSLRAWKRLQARRERLKQRLGIDQMADAIQAPRISDEEVEQALKHAKETLPIFPEKN